MVCGKAPRRAFGTRSFALLACKLPMPCRVLEASDGQGVTTLHSSSRFVQLQILDTLHTEASLQAVLNAPEGFARGDRARLRDSHRDFSPAVCGLNVKALKYKAMPSRGWV